MEAQLFKLLLLEWKKVNSVPDVRFTSHKI